MGVIGLVGLLVAANVVEAQATATATVTIMIPDRRTALLAGDHPEQHPAIFPAPSGNPAMERTTTLIRDGASFMVLHTEVPTL